ncbi:MAG: hypothetical protein IKF75_00425, partial [Lachnospiraceae bacterium]|nr:hypothetical protein [Lachnospiraceae bacterium]
MAGADLLGIRENAMREVNDQYPEFAEPYEPVKGGKHHKGLYGAGKKPMYFLFRFFILVGLLIIIMAIRVPKVDVREPSPETPPPGPAVTDITAEP